MNGIVTAAEPKKRQRSSRTETGPVTFRNAIPAPDLPFDPNPGDFSKEQIEETLVWFKEYKPRMGGTANFGFYPGKHFYDQMACHANLSSLSEEAYRGLIVTENGWDRYLPKKEKSFFAPFLSWLLFYSPYGKFILNRNDYESCWDGFVIDMQIPAPILMNICILTRHFYEVPEANFEAFNHLTLERGLDPTIAQMLTMNTGPFQNKMATYLEMAGHRVCWAPSPPDFIRIFKGEIGLDKNYLKPMKKVQSIYGGSSLFGRVEPLPKWSKKDQDFIDALQQFRKSKEPEKVYHPPNPFSKEQEGPRHLSLGQFTNKEFVEFVAPYVDTLVRQELEKNGR